MTGRLILPSAWDVGSAKIYESAGFAAVGTTSAGIAASRGYSDGEDVPFPAAAETAEGMAASLSIPLTADIEYGYARDREALLAISTGWCPRALSESISRTASSTTALRKTGRSR